MRMRIAAALAAILAAAAPVRAADDCALDPVGAPDKSFFVEAVVIGPASDEEVMQQTRVAIERTHAPMSPKYVALPRIDAVYSDGVHSHRTIAAVLDGPLPKAGDHVKLASRRRDPDQPCAFIPWTVVGKGTDV